MMYLTRLWLDPRSAQARRDLADPYDMHRTLVRAFVRSDNDKPPRFLWRIEPEGAWQAPQVLVQSAAAADWRVLEDLPGYLSRNKDVETKALETDRLLQGEARYRFRLFANPTVTRDGRRKGLVGEEGQLAWLARQGERFGFQVETALVTGSDLLRSHGGTHAISLLRACFEGTLRALEVEALAGALRGGIGPGKAFGCGLLSLARC